MAIRPSSVDKSVVALGLYTLILKAMLLEKVDTFSGVFFTRDELTKIATNSLAIHYTENDNGFIVWLDEAPPDAIVGVVYEHTP